MSTDVRPQDLAEEAVALVRRWLTEAKNYPVDPAAARLAGVLQDPHGLEFTVRFVEEVVRPADPRAPAKRLRDLGPTTPRSLAWPRSLVPLAGAPHASRPEWSFPSREKRCARWSPTSSSTPPTRDSAKRSRRSRPMTCA